ncbi:DUF421 domain-containing protein [Aureimonas altamirensis]|uniref:YetF domain-containing protein n=1 Tax=Aureimonas altamirensis TaxID=370622 RepID=UPI00203716BA|nr:YetF domain-containing protein [Aureimonas altamirensis]MCM2505241.1 DUF421 domain-containing protein [Aureimonas altamirensis]
MSVSAPAIVRNGIFFEVSIDVSAKRDIADVVLAVEPHLWRRQTQNSMIPAAANEAYGEGGFRYSYGPLGAGPRAERLLDGEPRIVIRDGCLIEDNLRRDRVTRAEVESEMRQSGIATMDDVAWGILEPQGKFSFIRRQTNTSE